MLRKVVCEYGENLARSIYIKRGFEIAEQNYFNHKGKRAGEIDFIALRGRHIHFVEVKTRTNNSYGEAIESITFPKQTRLMRASQLFLLQNPKYLSFIPHFDVVTVQISSVDKRRIKVKIYSDAW